MEYDEEEGLPFVIDALVGALPDGGVAVRFTYASSEQRFEAKEWDVAHFAMHASQAKKLAASLLSCSDGKPEKSARRH